MKSSLKGPLLEDEELEAICGQTTQLSLDFDECLRSLVRDHMNAKFKGFDLKRFEHINGYLNQ